MQLLFLLYRNIAVMSHFFGKKLKKKPSYIKDFITGGKLVILFV
jgi:hypothetical protein